jgi:hypothetical protein
MKLSDQKTFDSQPFQGQPELKVEKLDVVLPVPDISPRSPLASEQRLPGSGQHLSRCSELSMGQPVAAVLGEIWRFGDQRELPSGQTTRQLSSQHVEQVDQVLPKLRASDYPAWTYTRVFVRMCKVLFIACAVWIFLFGQPGKLVDAGKIFAFGVYDIFLK